MNSATNIVFLATGGLNGECAGLRGSPYYDTAEDAIKAWNVRAYSSNFEEREAAVCPEDTPFEDYIVFLKQECERKQQQIDKLCDAIVGKGKKENDTTTGG
jgi:hypothetical protein